MHDLKYTNTTNACSTRLANLEPLNCLDLTDASKPGPTHLANNWLDDQMINTIYNYSIQ